MSQLHLYVPDDLAEEVQRRAEAEGMTVSKYLASVVKRELHSGWPPGFFEEVVGGWVGEPLRRGPQGGYEDREDL